MRTINSGVNLERGFSLRYVAIVYPQLTRYHPFEIGTPSRHLKHTSLQNWGRRLQLPALRMVRSNVNQGFH